MRARTVESAFNNALASVLSRKHPRWRDGVAAERTGVLRESSALRPDIVIHHPGGVPVVVETEYEPARTVEQDAQARLGRLLHETGHLIESVVAVRVPRQLGEGRGDLSAGIHSGRFRYCTFSRLGRWESPIRRYPRAAWIEGSIDDLAGCIEQVSLSEDRITRGLDLLETTVRNAAERLSLAAAERSSETLCRLAEALHQEEGEQTTRMAVTILLDAFLFQAALAGVQGIEDPADLPSKRAVLRSWDRILGIDFWPIFRIAHDLLRVIPSRDAAPLLERLIDAASKLARLGTTTIHDLSGVLFQRLIADRKFLATFYTLPASAHLLAELAVARLDVDWADQDAVGRLRVADFACGTGALLSATQHRIAARLRRVGLDDRDLHGRMMESVLTGADIMPAAAHLTAAILSSAHPTCSYGNTRVYTMPYGAPEPGGERHDIGSLDLLSMDGSKPVRPLFETGVTKVRGTGADQGGRMAVDAPDGSFDLVIMNPPFTRPTNHESTVVPVPSFAGFATSEDEQQAMARRLAGIRRRLDMAAGHGNAGLASNFLDLAHAKVRPGGVIALVLPASFVQGGSWSAARRLLARQHEDVTVVSIATTGSTDRAFSADTGMAEVLVVATRRETRRRRGDRRPAAARFVNLLQRPRTILEAVTAARRIVEKTAEGRSSGRIALTAEETVGNFVRTDLENGGAAAIVEVGLAATMTALPESRLLLPRRSTALDLPVVSLKDLGRRGLVHRDINGAAPRAGQPPRGPFEILPFAASGVPTWPALWGHDARRETSLFVEPDRQGQPKPGCSRRVETVWRQTATRLHFNLDFRLNSQPLAACLTPEKSLGGTAWPNFRLDDEAWEPSVVLWANSTLGLMTFWWQGSRQQQGRARLTISRLPELLMLDPRALSEAQHRLAAELLAYFRELDLLPANEAWRDETRQALDEALLIDLLRLPRETVKALGLLRRQWCAEPTVHGGKPTRPE